MEERIKILVDALDKAKSRGDVGAVVNMETEIQLINVYLDAEKNIKIDPDYLNGSNLQLKFNDKMMTQLPSSIRTSLSILQSERINR